MAMQASDRAQLKVLGLWTIGIACFVLLTFGLTVLSALPFRIAEKIEITKAQLPTPIDPAAGWPELRVVLAAPYTQGSSAYAWRELMDWLGARLKRRIVLVQLDDCDAVASMIEERKADFGIDFSSSGYLFQHVTGTTMIASIGYGASQQPSARSYIFVSARSLANSFSELRGRSFIFLHPESVPGTIYPLSRAAELQQGNESFFSETTYSGSTEKSLSAVQLGIYDAGAINGRTWDRLVQEKSPLLGGLRVIERSSDFGTAVAIVSSSVDTSLTSQIRTALLTMDSDADGSQILSRLPFNSFVSYSTTTYATIGTMMEGMREKHVELPWENL